MRSFYLVTALLSISCGIVLAATNSQPNAEEIAFLTSHNLVRSRFNARPLNWSTTLADRAQTWASGCRFEHSNGQVGPYGENIAAGTGNFTDMDAMRMFMDGLREPSPSMAVYAWFLIYIHQRVSTPLILHSPILRRWFGSLPQSLGVPRPHVTEYLTHLSEWQLCTSAYTNLLVMWSVLCCQLSKPVRCVLSSQLPSATTSGYFDCLLVYQRFHLHFKLKYPRFVFVALHFAVGVKAWARASYLSEL